MSRKTTSNFQLTFRIVYTSWRCGQSYHVYLQHPKWEATRPWQTKTASWQLGSHQPMAYFHSHPCKTLASIFYDIVREDIRKVSGRRAHRDIQDEIEGLVKGGSVWEVGWSPRVWLVIELLAADNECVRVATYRHSAINVHWTKWAAFIKAAIFLSEWYVECLLQSEY